MFVIYEKTRLMNRGIFKNSEELRLRNWWCDIHE